MVGASGSDQSRISASSEDLRTPCYNQALATSPRKGIDFDCFLGQLGHRKNQPALFRISYARL
jgi:hypothetical protein